VSEEPPEEAEEPVVEAEEPDETPDEPAEELDEVLDESDLAVTRDISWNVSSVPKFTEGFWFCSVRLPV
jgi:hypothetical protein